MNSKKQGKRRWVYLIMGATAMVFTGFFYAWAILKAPFAETFGWTPAQLALNHTFSMIFIALGNILAGRLEKKIPVRFMIIGSAVLIFTGFSISSMMNDNILILYFSNALLCGIGIGAFVVNIISAVGKWFVDKNGLSTSCLQMGLGFGGMITGGFVTFMLDTIGLNWRITFGVLGAVVGTVLLITAFVIREPAEGDWVGAIKAKQEQLRTLEFSTSKMLRTKEFHHYYMMNLLVGTVGVVMMNFTNDYFAAAGCNKAFTVMMVGVVSVSNGIGRLLIGLLYDWRGRRAALFVTLASAIVGAGCLLTSAISGLVLFGILGAVLAGASYGFIPAAAGPIVREEYGEKYFASNYSVTLTSSMPASFMATVAGAILTSGGSFTTIYGVLLICSLLAGVNYMNIRKSCVKPE